MPALRFTATLLAASLLSSFPGRAQSNSFASPAPYAASVPAPGSLNWLPSGLVELSRQASTRTEFTLDRSTLGLVSKLSILDESTRNAVARLNGISVHLYHFPGPGALDPSAVQAIRAQYDLPGWQHLVSQAAHAGADGGPAGTTDVWLTTEGINVSGAAILLATSSSVNLISVSGNISTLDLLHLRGHFGIPQFSADANAH